MKTIILICIGLSTVLCASPLLSTYRAIATENLAKLLKSKMPNYEDLHNELWIVISTKGNWDSDEVSICLK